jgi:hypothetical protein
MVGAALHLERKRNPVPLPNDDVQRFGIEYAHEASALEQLLNDGGGAALLAIECDVFVR